jgi:hypothetical protein
LIFWRSKWPGSNWPPSQSSISWRSLCFGVFVVAPDAATVFRRTGVLSIQTNRILVFRVSGQGLLDHYFMSEAPIAQAGACQRCGCRQYHWQGRGRPIKRQVSMGNYLPQERTNGQQKHRDCWRFEVAPKTPEPKRTVSPNLTPSRSRH